MPIEIRELVIKATVGPEGQGAGGGGKATNAGSSDEVIKACVEKVMEILKEKNER